MVALSGIQGNLNLQLTGDKDKSQEMQKNYYYLTISSLCLRPPYSL